MLIWEILPAGLVSVRFFPVFRAWGLFFPAFLDVSHTYVSLFPMVTSALFLLWMLLWEFTSIFTRFLPMRPRVSPGEARQSPDAVSAAVFPGAKARVRFP